MSGTTQPAGAALAAKLDSLIEAHDQRIAALMDELARTQQAAEQYRELRALLDQVLEEPGMPSGTDSPADVAPRGTHQSGAGNPLSIDDVFHALEARPGQVLSPADVHRMFPNASRIQVNDRLGRLTRQGKITRVARGCFRFDPPADPGPAHPASFAQEQRDHEDGTLREQVMVIMRQAPGQGWWPRDLAAVVKRTNPDYLRSRLRDMVHSGDVVQDDAGRYWLPRPSVVVDGQAAGDRQVSMA
ncbi:hypothetical protein [Amycolatopsis cihanbeyliensis]|uniref:Uncharacterized protein n=1 Tax=Amycolatopsis cihanbeyliensis TaxID=1128664 RepID=A0A542DLF9_AMYCI|nr:hypothetical protein [Amycolatopsis cihanbeyliensis]TQJ03932.1 hypothetical protein FB471_3707 [Amycolatopsis cihanbeyliensis]